MSEPGFHYLRDVYGQPASLIRSLEAYRIEHNSNQYTTPTT